MKDQFLRASLTRSSVRLSFLATAVSCLSFAFLVQTAPAQAPGLLWTTNIGAKLFAVDNQTNLYANAGGKVIVLNSSGVPLRTNTICPLDGVARRDSAGNFYFAGAFTPPQDFGGIVLSNNLCFIVKYTSSGELLWATGFGPGKYDLENGIFVTDVVLDAEGDSYAGYFWSPSPGSAVARFDSSGSSRWAAPMPVIPFPGVNRGAIRMGGITQNSGYALNFNPSPDIISLSRFGTNGAATLITQWGSTFSIAATSARPIVNDAGELYNVEQGQLVKRGPTGDVIWTKAVGAVSYSWTVGPDYYGGVHVSDANGNFLRYDSDGTEAWSLVFTSYCREMVLDLQGNRFLWLNDNTIVRLGLETLSAPTFTNSPLGQTVLAGTSPALVSGASGSGPVRYSWLFNNSPVAGVKGPVLNLPNIRPDQAGLYSVTASNFFGSITSAPALLRVKSVEFYSGNQILTNGTYVFPSPPTLTLRSAFTNGSSFYTLDGSAPTFASARYSIPLVLSANANVRAIGYSADFSQSEEADPVNVIVLERHSLTVTSPGGGTISLNPSGTSFINTNVVSVTAVPSAGWSFLYWLGDATNNNPTTSIPMDRDKTLEAVFGTTFSTTVAGNGQVLLNPTEVLYPYATTVRLIAVPQPGNYFGAWGDAASGNANPLYFTLTNPNPSVSSIFGVLPTNQVALTILIDGKGRVMVNPPANAYTVGAGVTLTATPDPNQSFLNWSGEASGSQNPLTFPMSQTRTVTANFSSHPLLSADRPGLEGMSSSGFRFTLISDPQLAWQILGSSNLTSWQLLGIVTNAFGEVQFTDPTATGSPSRFYKAQPQP